MGGEVAVQAGQVDNLQTEGPRAIQPSQTKKPIAAKDAAPGEVSPTGQHDSGNVGQLLRGAYRQTVDEAIPDDLMDLLNRLE